MVDGRLSYRADFNVGQSVDASCAICSSPFTTESLDKFVSSFEEVCAEQKSAASTFGAFQLHTSLVMHQKDLVKAFGVAGELALTYGPVSGDANVRLTMDNVQGSLDMRLVVRATQSGHCVKNNYQALNALELNKLVANRLRCGALSVSDFCKSYGDHLIIGYGYGSQVLFESRYKTSCQSDKMAVAGGIGVVFGRAGFEVSGRVQGSFSEADVSRATDVKSTISVFPVSTSDKIWDVVCLLQTLGNPDANGVLFDEQDQSKFGNIRGKVFARLQDFLADKHAVTHVVVYPMRCIKCVSDEFPKLTVQVVRNLTAFNTTMNLLFLTIQEILSGIESVSSAWKNYDEANQKRYSTAQLTHWKKKLCRATEQMVHADSSDLHEFAERRMRMIFDDNWQKQYGDDREEIDKPFYQMDSDLLLMKFQSLFLLPFQKLVDSVREKEKE